MNCPRHPHKRVVTTCRECGTGFCIECVRETDQTTLCSECHRRRMDEFSREFASTAERAEEAAAGAAVEAGRSGRLDVVAEAAPTPSLGPTTSVDSSQTACTEDEGIESVSRRLAGAGRLWKTIRRGKGSVRMGRTSDREGKEVASSAGRTTRLAEHEAGEETDFLTLGPDEDFTELSRAVEKRRFRFPGRRRSAGEDLLDEASREREEEAPIGPAAVADERGRPRKPVVEEQTDATLRSDGKGMAAPAKMGQGPSAAREPRTVHLEPEAGGEEAVLDEVVSKLLQPESGGRTGGPTEEVREARTAAGDGVDEVLSTLLQPDVDVPTRTAKEWSGVAVNTLESPSGALDLSAAGEVAAPGLPREVRRGAEERRRAREEREKRWSFLAQPRVSEHTEIASSWWRAALFILLMLVLGAVLWAVPNAYLVPKDTEYGIHAVAIGVLLGLLFWWKAGRKHGTKLAVQAALVTFFALFLGEFLHWFLIITKNAALRTVFFDLISFRFIWEHGAEVMRHTMEAMFPGAFIWIMIMPTLLAFIIGFGMPPIPEIFLQIGRAARG